MWFATRNGISSYDGLKFKNYTNNDGLVSQSYSFIRLDQKGNLWALPGEGALLPSIFTGTRWKSDVTTNTFHKGFLYTAFEVYYINGKLEIVCGTTENGVFLYQDGHWKNFTTADGLKSNTIYDIEYNEQSIYIATHLGLSILKNGKISEVQDPALPNARILSLAVDTPSSSEKKFRLYILTDKWIGFLEDSKINILTSSFQFTDVDPGWRAFVKPDKTGGLYYGSPFFVNHYLFKTEGQEFLDRKSGLISDGATDIFIDRELNTWITGYRGITKIQSRRFSSYTSDNGLFNDEVASAIELSPGKFAFGHYGAISFLENNKFTHLILIQSEEKRQNLSRILELAKDKQGNLWAAVSTQGIVRINKNKSITWFRKPEGIGKVTNSVICTPAGKIYAATNANFLEFVNGKFKIIPLRKTGSSSIRKLFNGPDNSIFIATISGGLIEYKNNTEIFYTSKVNTQANSIYSVYIDSNQTRWVGTSAGLFFIDGTNLVNADKKKIVIRHPVYLIIGDNTGNLWVGTDNGIYRWNGRKLDHFTVTDGLSGQELNRSAGIVDSKNHIWFGTNNGITVYQPEFEFDLNKIPPPIINLIYFTAGKDSLNFDKPHVLENTNNSLTLHIRITSLLNEKLVTYRYKIMETDSTWSEEKPYTTDEIVFSNLQPGTYHFCIMAKNAAGVWSTAVCAQTITINQPLFFRWWFLGLTVFLIIAIAFLTSRFILVNRYNKQLESTVEERTRALLESEEKLKESNAAKDKFFTIIAHDLKSPFNTLLGMLDILISDADDISNSERNRILLNLNSSAKRTFSLLNNLLTWARAQKGIIPFIPIKLLVSDIIMDTIALSGAASSSKNITVEAFVDEGLELTADRNMIQTVIRNILSNAIKFTNNGGQIFISAVKENDKIIISIRDTGHGMTQEYINKLFKIDKLVVSKDTNNDTGTGLGLILCKDFITKHNGTIWVSSTRGTGSTFFVSLPHK